MGTSTAKRAAIGAMALLMMMGGSASAEEAHHLAPGAQPPQTATQPSAPTQPSQPSNPAPQGGMMPMMGMMGQGGMGMMGQDGMGMMGMMGQGGMMGGGSPADMRMMFGHDAMIDRIEGRIAFLRAELKIADAQDKAWSGYADALRANAKRLGELRAAARQNPATTTLVDRLDRQERWLAARVEGVRAIKTGLASLYAILTEDQKKAAEELLGSHMGFAPMGMTSAGGGGMR